MGYMYFAFLACNERRDNQLYNMARYPEMNWGAPNVSEEFKLFKQRMELYLLDNEVTDSVKQAIKIKLALGNEGLRKINASGLSEEDQKKPDKIRGLFESQLRVSVSFRIHRLELMRFHSYLFGKAFTVETDHRPLEMIWRKPLACAPCTPSPKTSYQDSRL